MTPITFIAGYFLTVWFVAIITGKVLGHAAAVTSRPATLTRTMTIPDDNTEDPYHNG